MTTATLTRREELEKAVADMRAKADEIDAKADGPTAEDQETIEKMGKAVNDLIASIKTAATADGTIDVAKAFLGSLAEPAPDQKTPTTPDDRADKTGIVNPQGMTLGEAVEKSPQIQDFIKTMKGNDGQIRSGGGNMKAPILELSGGFHQKSLVTGLSDTSGGAFVTPTRFPTITDLIGERPLTIRDLCTNINITTDVFEYVTITAKTNNAAAVIEATTSADSAVYGTPTAGNVQGYKPESALTLAVVSSPVETIAHFIPITRRAAADAPQVRGLVDAFLFQGLREKEEDQIYGGNGTSPNLKGITAFAISTVGSAGTDIDAVVDAIRTIRLERRSPNGLVIHPNDWYSTGFLLAKDTTGRYLIGDPSLTVTQQQTLWGLRVVVSEAATENTALVGDFTQAVVADRQQSTIYVTDSNRDWFERNLLAILAEERLGFGVLDPKAFCSITAV